MIFIPFRSRSINQAKKLALYFFVLCIREIANNKTRLWRKVEGVKCRLNAERVTGSQVVWLPSHMPRLHVAGVQVTVGTWNFLPASKVSATYLFRNPCTQAFSLSTSP